jgi:hypothetical protein
MSGAAANFDLTQDYSLLIAQASGGVTGFDPASISVGISGFPHSLPGREFTVSESGGGVFLNLTTATTSPGVSAVPEPMSATLLLIGLIAMSATAYRPRRNRR